MNTILLRRADSDRQLDLGGEGDSGGVWWRGEYELGLGSVGEGNLRRGSGKAGARLG